MNNSVLFIIGFAVTVIGITLVLHNWNEVYLVAEGVLSPAVAVAGLVIMFAATLRK